MRILVLWCTLVGGQVLEESDRWATESDSTADRATRYTAAVRRMGVHQFLSNVRSRRRAASHKQFVRLSVPMTHDWKESLEHLTEFASLWLKVEASPPLHPGALNGRSLVPVSGRGTREMAGRIIPQRARGPASRL
jgi:hypothetical protein